MPREVDYTLVNTDTVALLTAEEFTQSEIGKKLGVSQSLVSRLQREAKAAGKIRTQLNLNKKEIEVVTRRLMLVDIADNLTKTTVQWGVSRVDVFDSLDEIGDLNQWKIATQRFASVASSILEGIATRENCIGVTWGRVLDALVSVLERRLESKSLARTPREVFVPLWGEEVGPVSAREREHEQDNRSNFSSSRLVERLTDLFCSGIEPLSLRGIPGFLPAQLKTASARREITRYFGYVSAHNRIFQAERPLIDELDTVITSCGSLKQKNWFWSEHYLQEDAIKKIVNDTVIGDLGGVFIARNGLKSADMNRLKSLGDRQTGINRKHFIDIASRARRKGTPGVVVFAVGADRAEVLLECCRNETVNWLVLDRHCADSLMKLTARDE